MITKKRIEDNWLNIREKINKANGSLNSIKVLPVTKSVGADEIKALINLGFTCFAENRIESLAEKIKTVSMPNIHWDFIGNLQRRKIPEILTCTHLIHSVSSNEIIAKINSYAQNANIVANILLQINIAEEPQKGGFSKLEIKQKISEYLKLDNIKIKGLMTMAPQTNDQNLIGKTFEGLRKLRDQFKKDAYADFQELSMGMSNDFEIAIKEGSTILRIGSLFFKEQEL